jgi:hypothetical protein
MKLEINHILPYLEHGLKGDLVNLDYFDSQINKELYRIETGKTEQQKYYDVSVVVGDCESSIIDFKPILRPLSDLTFEDMEVLKDKYDVIEGSTMFRDKDTSINPTEWRYDDIQYLFSRHFDVFGLIEKGLAIDVNTLKQ